MQRPTGKRIIEACSEIERLDRPCTVSDVNECMQIERSNVSKYLSRAIGMGLLTTDRTAQPRSYSVIMGWRDRIKPMARIQPSKARPVFYSCAVKTHHLQGIWA